MAKSIQEELRQRKPYRTLEQEASVSLARTAALIEYAAADVLRAHGLTPTQYNVLRILRGAEPHGLGRNAVRERLVFPVSDVTRLLDRLVDMGLVVRTRGREDRRVVLSRITDAGFDRIAPLDSVIERLHRRQLGRLGPRKLRELLALLAEARESIRAAVGE
ncbi:MAG TPA: MarR family transcriptional regulator [Gemmatimonadales bacterium]|jgi:DNA-binding MarR family transcriptional regulator